MRSSAGGRSTVGIVLVCLGFSPVSSMAQGAAAPPPGPTAGAALEVLAALAAVLVLFVLLAWLLRRLGPGRKPVGGVLRVVGGVAVGPRERVVLVEVGETWLVVGVAAGSVTALHTMPRPESAADATPTVAATTGAFAGKLHAMLQPDVDGGQQK